MMSNEIVPLVRFVSIVCIAGIKNASVLPVPVFAWTRQSFRCSKSSSVAAWTGIISSNFKSSVIVLRIVGSIRPAMSLKRRTAIELDDISLAAATAADTMLVGLTGAFVTPFVVIFAGPSPFVLFVLNGRFLLPLGLPFVCGVFVVFILDVTMPLSVLLMCNLSGVLSIHELLLCPEMENFEWMITDTSHATL